MKLIMSLALVFSATAHAQFKGACAQETVKCDFYRMGKKGEKSLIENDEKKFTPSLTASECAVSIYSDVDYDDTIMITVSDRNRNVDISVVDRLDGPLHSRDAGVSFSTQEGQSFYFRHKDHLSVCKITK